MKKIFVIAIGALALVSCNSKGSFDKPKNYMDSVSYSYGMSLGSHFRAEGVGKTDSMNLDALIAGIRAGLDSTGLITKAQADSIMEKFAQSVNEKEMAKVMETHDKYVKEISQQEGVKMTESGLMYKIIKEGAGNKPDANDSVVVDMAAYLLDGKEFYATRADKPDVLPITLNPGLIEGLPLMSVGSKYEFYIPQHLAYGERGNQGMRIPPFAALKFVIDLKDIKAVPNK